MGKQIRFAVLLTCALASSAFGTTYYIAANGADSNSGTSKTSPWLHAPGMSGCAGNCASKTPQPGDQFIFKGGDKWHRPNWTWTWSGNSSNRIYVGVDKTWFSGTSWTRPIMDGDNPSSKSKVSSCSFNANGAILFLKSVNYVTQDSFEFTGMCWQGAPGYGLAVYIVLTGTNITISNNYLHGWTHTTADGGVAIQGTTYSNQGQNNQLAFNVVDGDDTDGVSLRAVYGDCYEAHANVFRNMANGPICNNMHKFYDNLIENVSNSFDPAEHSNGFEFNGEWDQDSNYVYNNILRNVGSAVGAWPLPSGNTDYYFNNVYYGGPSANFWNISGSGTVYMFNNTFVLSSKMRTQQGYRGPLHLYGNHFITNSGSGINAVLSNETGASVDENANVYQTTTAAADEGYVGSNSYAPTDAGDATIGAGVNLSGTCKALTDPEVSAACSNATTLACTYDSGSHSVRCPGQQGMARPESGTWDAGAYQYSDQAGRPESPTNLQADVH